MNDSASSDAPTPDSPAPAPDAPTRPPSATLAEALQRCEIELPADQIEKLEAYCQLLWRYNEQLNLTRHTTYDLFAARDVLDAWQLAQALEPGEEVLDVGSGGGVPGIPLTILRDDLQVALCESVGKKARVLDEMVEALELPLPVYHSRAEDLLDDFRFDTITARAVGPLWKICTWFQNHWGSFGRLLLIKGPKWVEERGEARHRGLLHHVDLRKFAEYQTPGLDGACVLLQLRRSS